MDEDEIRRLQHVQRRAWGAAFAGMAFLVLMFFVAGLLLLLSLWRLVAGSPTLG